jgi:hypothetical protein
MVLKTRAMWLVEVVTCRESSAGFDQTQFICIANQQKQLHRISGQQGLVSVTAGWVMQACT